MDVYQLIEERDLLEQRIADAEHAGSLDKVAALLEQLRRVNDELAFARSLASGLPLLV